MSTKFVSVLSIVNAPYSDQLTGDELAHALTDIDVAKKYPGQVSSFLGEVPLEGQLEFAAAHGVSEDTLKATAQEFADWSGESYRIFA